MTGLEVVQQLMIEIGPQLDLAEVTEFTEEQSWVLVVDDDTLVSIGYDDRYGKLVFTSEVAVPPGESRFPMYERLLVFNNQWPSTGGLRFALDTPAGTALLLFDLPLVDIDLPKLADCVSSYLEQLEIWRLFIAEGVQTEEPTDAEAAQSNEPQPGGLPSGMIRA